MKHQYTPSATGLCTVCGKGALNLEHMIENQGVPTETDRRNSSAVAFELTIVERAAVLRCCREKRDDLKVERDRLIDRAHKGDKTADSAARVLDAEISILQAAVRTLWRQSGCDPPIEDR